MCKAGMPQYTYTLLHCTVLRWYQIWHAANHLDLVYIVFTGYVVVIGDSSNSSKAL
jgi:hypothetical protein